MSTPGLRRDAAISSVGVVDTQAVDDVDAEVNAEVSAPTGSRSSRLLGPGRMALGPGRRPLRRSTRIGVPVVAAVAVLATLIFAGHWLFYTHNYVSTDNAQIDGDQVQINSPATGTLLDWQVSQGTAVRKDAVLGHVRLTGGGGQPEHVIRAPEAGTVALNAAVNGEQVSTATPLATVYNLSNLYATARVEETDIADVHPGEPVDIDVDSYPGTSVTGVVEQVQAAATGQVALFPEDNSNGNYQKETQVIPVRIDLTDTAGLRLVPGMSITVHIAKR